MRLGIVLLAATVGGGPPAAAADWPQFRGPEGQGTAPAASGLLPEWPPAGPAEIFRRPVGIGYSAVTVVGERIYTLSATEGEEQVLCLEAATGAEIWATPIGPSGVSDMNDSAPRSTPSVAEGRVFAASSAGLLVALDAADGSVLWSRDLTPDGKAPRFGFSVSPLVDRDQVVIEGGASEEDPGIYAFDAATGEGLWQALSGPAGYSTPVRIELGGQPQYVFFRRAGAEVVALSPNGALLWRHPTQALAIITSPIFLPPDRLFVASADDAFGGLMLRVRRVAGAFEVEEAWSERLMRNHFNTSVVVGEQIYGFDNGTLRCLDTATGALRWARRGLGKGSLIASGARLYVLGDDGTLVLLEATPEAYSERGRFQALSGRAWTAPSLAEGRLYLRDFDELVAFDLHRPGGAPPPEPVGSDAAAGAAGEQP